MTVRRSGTRLAVVPWRLVHGASSASPDTGGIAAPLPPAQPPVQSLRSQSPGAPLARRAGPDHDHVVLAHVPSTVVDTGPRQAREWVQDTSRRRPVSTS